MSSSQSSASSTHSSDQAYRVTEYSDEVHAEVPEDLRVGEYNYKYRMVDGRVMPPYITPARYALSRRIKTKATDVCYTSFPKSGSTWLSYILVLLTGTSRGESLRSTLHWVESSWTYPRNEEELALAPDSRIFKSHMPYSMALGGVPSNNPCRYIYIARNPKDTCVSYYKFESGKSWSGYYGGGWEHWLQMFIEGKNQRGDWFDHVLSWWEASKTADNILFVRFEDLKRDTEGQLKKIADFLDLKLTNEQLTDVKEKIGFNTMKSDGFSGLKDVKEFNAFFREGEIGSWKECFTVAQSEAFDRLYAERTKGSGMIFDFE